MNKSFFLVIISVLLALSNQARSQMVPDSLSSLPFAAVEVNYSLNCMMYYERITKLSTHRQYAQHQGGKLLGGLTNKGTTKITYVGDTICFYTTYDLMKLIVDTSQKIIKSLKYGHSIGSYYQGLSLKNVSYKDRVDQPLFITLHDSLFDSCFQSYETGTSGSWTENGATFHEATYSLYLNKDTANTITIRLYSPVALGVPSQNIEQKDNQLALYPNPARSTIMISATSQAIGKTLRVYDLLGRVVLQQQYQRVSTIDVSSLLPGNYICSLHGKAEGLVVSR